MRSITSPFEKDAFADQIEKTNEIYHEELGLRNFLQTKAQVRSLNTKYYDLYYTVIKNRKEKDDVEEQYKINDDDLNNTIQIFQLEKNEVSDKAIKALYLI